MNNDVVAAQKLAVILEKNASPIILEIPPLTPVDRDLQGDRGESTDDVRKRPASSTAATHVPSVGSKIKIVRFCEGIIKLL